MTCAEFIASKFSQMGYTVLQEEVGVLLEGENTPPADTFSKTTLKACQRVMLAMIPDLLLLPDATEGDLSIKRNVEGLKSYYGMLCTQLGVDNLLSQPVIRNASNLW